jgi:hypothetical protein
MDYDKYYQKKKEERLLQLKEEYAPIILSSRDKRYVIKDSIRQIDERKSSLCKGLTGDLIVVNRYKEDLLERFLKCHKYHMESPVDAFVKEIPDIRQYHLNRIATGWVTAYEYDHDFIEIADPLPILDFIAESHAYDDFTGFLRIIGEQEEKLIIQNIDRYNPTSPLPIIWVYKEPATLTEERKADPKSFKWTGNQAQLLRFFDLLRQGSEFIHENTDLKGFEKLFSNTELEKPLKIRWMVSGPLKPDYPCKTTLFYLFQELEMASFIEKIMERKDLFQIIHWTFVDYEGKQLINLKESYQGYLKKSDEIHLSEKIQGIIKELKSDNPYPQESNMDHLKYSDTTDNRIKTHGLTQSFTMVYPQKKSSKKK